MGWGLEAILKGSPAPCSMQSWVLGQCQSYWPYGSFSCSTLAQVSAGVGCDVPVSPGIKEGQRPRVEKAMSPCSSTLA